MEKDSLAVSLAIWLALSPLGLTRQSPTQTKNEEIRSAINKPTDSATQSGAQSQRLQLQQRGIDLIKDAGKEAGRLDDPRRAARIQTAAGEALWLYDKEVARKFFRTAFEAALTYYREGKNEIPNHVAILTGESRSDLCLEIIRRISLRDAALGRDCGEVLNEEKRRGQEEGKRNKARESPLRSVSDINLSNDLDKAASLLRINQQSAIAEAKTIYSRGIPKSALLFVWQLAVQDRAAADQLFLWLLASIRSDEAADAGQLQVLAPYPFGDQVIWITDGIGGQAVMAPAGLVARARAMGSEELLIQWYIEASFAVLSRIAASDLSDSQDATSRIGAAFYLARWLEPRVAQARPQLLPAWHSIIDQLSPRLLPRQQSTLAAMSRSEEKIRDEPVLQLKTQPEDTTERIRKLLERAEKIAQISERDHFYQEAALEADHTDNLSWALQITDKISDQHFRQQVRDWIYFNAAKRALDKRNVGEARSYAREVKAPDQCAYLFCILARSALREKDKVTAAELLAEAEQHADKADDSPAKMHALVRIANLLSGFDLPHALETMSLAVRAVNRMQDFDPEPGRMVRSLGNATGSTPALIQNGEPVDLGTGMAALAAMDFERTVALAQSLENKSLKLTAIISVASSVLKEKSAIPVPVNR